MFKYSLIILLCDLARGSTVTTKSMALKAVDFEVFGRVQGVFFRKRQPALLPMLGLHKVPALGMYTKDQADKLGLRGWCMNTDQGTVLGHMEGTNDKIESMMHWLKTTGSPSSLIDKAEFKNQKDISEYEFEGFKIRR